MSGHVGGSGLITSEGLPAYGSLYVGAWEARSVLCWLTWGGVRRSRKLAQSGEQAEAVKARGYRRGPTGLSTFPWEDRGVSDPVGSYRPMYPGKLVSWWIWCRRDASI